MKKKIFSIVLAGTMAVSVATAGALAVSADEENAKTPGSIGKMGEYTPSDAKIKTNRLMFAMPGAWQNDTTKDPKCNGSAGMYWWSGFDTPDSQKDGHWPGWKTTKVTDEEGIDNLFAIDVPTYGNGEAGNATQIIWNNYIDGGTETDASKNPYYEAACQTRDFPGQYYSRTDEHEQYDILFRYIYKTELEKLEVPGVAELALDAENFWVDINKLAAAYNEEDWDKLTADEKTYQIDNILDEVDVDFSAFGDYAGNFFNEDLAEDIYPAEESNGFGMSFTFDNMVFVVSFDPSKMQVSPVSGKIGFDGDFYFYYGNGEYGIWPTKELCEANGSTVGSFVSDEYLNTKMEDISLPSVPATDADSKTTTVPGPQQDASSSTKDTPSGSNTTNNSNGAIATGQFSFVAIVLVVLIAGVGAVYFTRKKVRK